MTAPRTRFAPSPTGALHVGNVRTAVFNWLFTRAHGGTVILRIEDTDLDRNTRGSEERIREDLLWLGLDWDEGPDVGGEHGPYRQSERMDLYREAAERLVTAGRAFPARGGRDDDGEWERLSTREADQFRAEGGAVHIRFDPGQGGPVPIHDAVRGEITFPREEVGEFVLLREDGRPTYHFAVVVDDIAMEVTHVIRGAGHLSNTPKHVLLYEAMDAPLPVFVHLPTVLGPDRTKLSKRTGAAAVAELREEGVPPDAIVNYLSLLGWSSPDGEEILTREQLVSRISLDRIDATDTVYDRDKLMWVVRQHVHNTPLDELEEIARSRLPPGMPADDPSALRVALEAIRPRISSWADIPTELAPFAPTSEELAAARDRIGTDREAVALLGRVAGKLRALDRWDPDEIEMGLRSVADEEGVGVGKIFRPVREAVSGKSKGPSLGAILTVVGRVQVLERLLDID